MSRPTFAVQTLVRIEVRGVQRRNNRPPDLGNIVSDLLSAISKGELPCGVGPMLMEPGRFVDYYREREAWKVMQWLEQHADERLIPVRRKVTRRG